MPSAKVLEQKKQIVAGLAETLKNSVAGVIVDYKGITVADDTALRKELREAGVQYTVVKNRNDNVAPYRVYRMLDKYHKRQIAKCADLASAVSVIYGQIMEGR